MEHLMCYPRLKLDELGKTMDSTVLSFDKTKDGNLGKHIWSLHLMGILDRELIDESVLDDIVVPDDELDEVRFFEAIILKKCCRMIYWMM